jgi:hypothetical protein
MNVSRYDLVSASEIASWEWCPESWRLDAVGAEPTNGADRQRGKRHHARVTWVEVWSRRAKRAALALVILALLIAAWAYFLGESGR